MANTKVSAFVEYRLERFEELVQDKKYKARSIQGLKNWKASQSYRLTSFDVAVIDSAIRKYSK